ncbi:PhnD/SsuA/transferrin family substrate-binding protein [Candidatus Sulfurimonas marisnigri]|uniref:PhnD/SsuA/transferrin family substrate-binding protein n=1 Tax=Candidatus Sulfurimonas marisnigri TaxID=2740405 RepID=A0A7S7LZB8_9BACT|nr:PhnD/SsuA/transferrin family substrate-binding protein [Candidatus Sulfurimonas marisnigri]QOY54216.1 PhnD/SsuA/transferrin family substrate-binding protein [Candidatus Sulfurimonas marisnigri]
MIKVILISLFCFFVLLPADTLHVGSDASSVNDVNIKDMTIATDVWLKEIAKEINLDTSTTIYENPAHMAQDFADGKLDYVAAFGLVFVKYFDLSKLSDGFAQAFLNGEKETFVVVVNKESGINTLSDLEGKSISIQEYDEAAKLYIEYKIKEKLENLTTKFETYPSRQRALLKLFFGKVKAAVSTNKSYALATELNPQIGQKLKIIEITNLQATTFGFLSKSMNENTKKLISNGAKNIHKTKRGRQLLTLYKTEMISDSKLEDLKPFQELYDKTNHLNKKGK